MTTTRPTAAQILQRCIARCTRSRDGRGRWRAERDCTAELGGSQLDARCVGAARRIGEWLGSLGHPWHAAIGRPTGPDAIPQAGHPKGSPHSAPRRSRGSVPVPPAPYTADELERDNPHNAWLHG